ncbi:unnamed protein product [Mytilus edulis]|uniref:Uncharacterized protein n=1 Tax=Mytilus edulis TaxID=6550 RepID=A0A8S3VGI6_MYTED|nr:unnamed protein product [Mytilus edulis]
MIQLHQDKPTEKITSGISTPTTYRQTTLSEVTTKLTTHQLTTTAELTTHQLTTTSELTTRTTLDDTTKFTSPKMTLSTPKPTTFDEITSTTITTKTTENNDLISTADQSTHTTLYDVTSTTDKAEQSTSVETTPSTSYMFKTTLEKTTSPTKGVIETQSTKVGDTTRSDTTNRPTITSTTQSTKFEPTTHEVTTEGTKLTTINGRTTQKLGTSATTKNPITTMYEQKSSPLEEDTSTKADETSVAGEITTSDTQMKNEISDGSSDEMRVVYVISSSFGAVIIVALIATAVVSLYYRTITIRVVLQGTKEEKVSSRKRSHTRYYGSEISLKFDEEDWTSYGAGSFQYGEKELPFTNFRYVKKLTHHLAQ